MSTKRHQEQEVHLLVKKYPTVKFVEINSNGRSVFVPVLLAVRISRLIGGLVEDIGVGDVVETPEQQIIPLPIKNKYFRALLDYGYHLQPNRVSKYLGEINEPSRSKIHVFIGSQSRIFYDLGWKHLVSLDDIYLRLDLASYLEDNDYFGIVMEDVYERWSRLRSSLVTGPIAEVNYDIYTFTPWFYLPADLITSPSFIASWLANMGLPKTTKTIHINNTYHITSSDESGDFGLDDITDTAANDGEFHVMINMTNTSFSPILRVPPHRSTDINSRHAMWRYPRLMAIYVTFYPDRSRIRYEEIRLWRPYHEILGASNGGNIDSGANNNNLLDRVATAIRLATPMRATLKPIHTHKLFRIDTYWDETGKIVKCQHYLHNSTTTSFEYVSHYHTRNDNHDYKIRTYYPQS